MSTNQNSTVGNLSRRLNMITYDFHMSPKFQMLRSMGNPSVYLIIIFVLILTSTTISTAGSTSTVSGSIIAQLDDKVIIPCETVPNLNITEKDLVIWKKNGIIVAILSKMKSLLKKQVLENRDLLIESAKASDSGLYECQISSLPPRVFSKTLVVQYPPELQGVYNEKVVIEWRKNFSMLCNISANPTPEFVWLFNGKPLILPSPSDNNYGFETDEQHKTLTWKSIEANATGVYECSASNRLGKASKKWDITVKSPPRVEVKPYMNGAPGKMMTLTCRIKSNPVVNVTWFKDGNLVDINSNTLIQNKNDETEAHVLQTSLIIERMKESDFNSVYKCVGVNDMGFASVNLSVKGIPEIVEIHRVTEEVNEEDGSNSAIIEFSTVSHTPLHEFKLILSELNNGKFAKEIMIPADTKLQDTYHQFFKLTGLRPNTEYVLIMQARNEYGWSEIPLKPTLFQTNAIYLHETHPHKAQNVLSSAAIIIKMPIFPVISTVLLHATLTHVCHWKLPGF